MSTTHSLAITHLVIREGRDLLNTRDGDIINTLVLAFLQKRVVHLTAAEYMSPDLVGSDEVLGVRVRDVALEVCIANHL